MESATGTLDSLSCFVHGDAATGMELTSRLREGVPNLYTKPLTGIGSRERRGGESIGYLLSPSSNYTIS
jgi:hypothetical protein